jgi:hypothetical protein
VEGRREYGLKNAQAIGSKIFSQHPPRPPQTPSKAGLLKRGELEIEIKNPFKV